MIAPRRWFAFRLRTLFVVVAVLAVPVAWVAYSLEWIKQRHEAIDNYYNRYTTTSYAGMSVEAPWQLRPFGEWGQESICLVRHSRLRAAEVARLFPEALIVTEEVFVEDRFGARWRTDRYYKNGDYMNDDMLRGISSWPQLRD